MLEIACGMRIKPEDADLGSSAAHLADKPKSAKQHQIPVVLSTCPGNPNLDVILSATTIRVEDLVPLTAALRREVLGSAEYTCDQFDTPECPKTTTYVFAPSRPSK